MSLGVYTCYVKILSMDFIAAGPPGQIGMECAYMICNVLTNGLVNTISTNTPYGFTIPVLDTPIEEILVKEKLAEAIQAIETATPAMVFTFMP